MKKKIFEFIKKADFVLVFVFAFLGIIALGAALINDLLPFHRTRAQQIAVIEDVQVEIKEHLEFERKIKDVYIFSVKSSAIKVDEAYGTEKSKWSGNGFSNLIGRNSDGDGITNLVFVKNNGREEYKLFPANVFIYKYCLAEVEEEQPPRYPQEYNVYAVVKNDTTNDKILNSEDDIALYVSDYDGTHVKEIASSIITFRFLGGEEILFSEYDGTVQSYFVYDCKTNVKTLIKSIKQEIIEKEIALYK